MKVHQDTLRLETSGKGLSSITDRVQRVVSESGVDVGLCTVFVKHTSASLIIQENADPAVLRDLARWFSDLAPESRHWEHSDEGPDDMPAHARSAVTKTSEVIPVSGGRLNLGTWQGIFLFEHRSRPHTREVVVHIAGTER